MQSFVAVAEEEGFGAAARRLGVSPPVVTRNIAALEARLGALLLERTTRKVRVTEAGARYLLDCKRLLAEIDDAEAAVSGEHSKPRGALGVTASVMFGRLFVAPILVDFLAKYPQVSARALLLDQVVDLMDEGLDVAVRIARLEDSTLTSTKVGAVRRITFASPAYLEKHGVPKSPSRSGTTSLLRFLQRAFPARVELRAQGAFAVFASAHDPARQQLRSRHPSRIIWRGHHARPFLHGSGTCAGRPIAPGAGGLRSGAGPHPRRVPRGTSRSGPGARLRGLRGASATAQCRPGAGPHASARLRVPRCSSEEGSARQATLTFACFVWPAP